MGRLCRPLSFCAVNRFLNKAKSCVYPKKYGNIIRCIEIIMGNVPMTVINAIILGLVQGIAEFLPISSSGHLAILNNLFGMTTTENGHMFFDVLPHLGTLISICIVYWQDIVDMFYEVLAFANLGPRAGERQSAIPRQGSSFMIVLATVAAVLILPINDMLEGLYYNNVFIGMALILTGAMLYVSDKMKPGRKNEKQHDRMGRAYRPLPVRRHDTRPLTLQEPR